MNPSKNKVKTASDRINQCINLQKKLEYHGMNMKLESIAPLKAAMNEYIRSGQPDNGKVFVPEAGIYVHYLLTTRKSVKCQLVLSKSGRKRF